MKITTVGVDLAKNVFQVHAVDERGKAVLRKQLRRAQVAVFFANLPPCVIGMEACASAHYWGRTLARFGHTVRLMASQFVKPYVKTNKNDAADAEAICEAVGRANTRFVPIKSIEQQAILSVHRVRQGFVKARTAQANQIRGLLGEFGLVIPQGIVNVTKRVPELLEDAGRRFARMSIQMSAATSWLFSHSDVCTRPASRRRWLSSLVSQGGFLFRARSSRKAATARFSLRSTRSMTKSSGWITSSSRCSLRWPAAKSATKWKTEAPVENDSVTVHFTSRCHERRASACTVSQTQMC